MSLRRVHYRIGFIWCGAVAVLLPVLLAWLGGRPVPVGRGGLMVFVGWLLVVPALALLLQHHHGPT